MSGLFWSAVTAMTGLSILLLLVPVVRTQTLARHRLAMLIPAVLLPLTAIPLYLFWGDLAAIPHSSALSTSEQHLQASLPVRSGGAAANTRVRASSVASLLDGLTERLTRNPDDADGWLLLAKSYRYLGRDDDAAAAYRQALVLGAEDAALSEALHNGQISAQNADTRVPRVRGTVKIAPALDHLIDPQDTLFVFAKAMTGPPMPLAVIRTTAGQLPLDFELHDGLAMMANLRLSDFDNVVVSARISKNGQAQQSAGDLLADGVVVSLSEDSPTQPVQLLIAAQL